jgi:zinc D-Ala-D-Ala carboxypeptidase
MSDQQLGKFFTLREFTRSATASAMGHPNDPPPECVVSLRKLVATVLDPLREEEGAVRITSGYRAPDVNRALGGSTTSQHCRGEAADFKLVFEHDAERVAAVIYELELPVDQCIWYEPEVGGHVHVSHSRNGHQRGQFLRCFKADGEKRYATFRTSRPSYSL